MKKLILAFLLVVSVLSLTYAQRGQGNGKFKGQQMAKELNLTPEQQEQMKGIRATHRGEFHTIRTSDASREEKIAGMNALHSKVREEVALVLDDDQMVKWDELHAKRKKKSSQMREKRQQNLEKLNLDEAQADRLKAMREEHRSEMLAIRSSDLTREEKKAEAEAQRARIESDVQSILTPEQYEEWKAMRENRPHRDRQFKR